MMTKYYHATAADNFSAILSDGVLKPGLDGCVHLTSNPNRAIKMVAIRGATDVAVFSVEISSTDVMPFVDGVLSGDECFVHKGEVHGVKLVDVYHIDKKQ